MDISVRSTSYGAGDNSWLDSTNEGVKSAKPVTLDISKFNAAQYANGYLPSGTVLGLVGGTDPGTQTAGPYDDTATDGREVAAGFLLGDVHVRSGATKVAGAILRGGEINPNRLPFQDGQAGAGFLDAAGIADLEANFRFRTA